MPQKNQELLKFNAEIGKVLQLMIHSLYTNKDIFLRELVSNASDACDKLRYAALTQPELLQENADIAIRISFDKDARTITLADSGIGMNRDELIHNLGTIAKSGTQEFLAQLTGDAKKDTSLIGQFGVGFYSAFMVADKVTVVSKRAGTQEAWQWQSDGAGEFTIEPSEKETRGTSITLNMKEAEEQYLDSFRLRHIVETYSNHIAFPIFLSHDGHEEAVNTGSALWTKSKGEITPEQYAEFYHHVSHSPDEPWLTLHNKNEGKVEYTNLLFIPSIKPFDLYHPDRKRRVKLYVKRVFITEENIDIVPQYLRFLRGVVDSEDLPLNISRETLQHNPVLTKISESLVKRTLSELKKKSEEESYGEFWRNFGPVLKEGLCEGHSPREAILEVCRFDSSMHEATSLDSYVNRMKPGQEFIYYLTGEHLAALKSSPQLEGFLARDVEVLLLHDHVDDFWVNVVQDYKGKLFKSITRSDIALEQFPKTAAENEPEKPIEQDTLDALCKRMKTVLGEAVKDVRVSHKLSQSAVCLAVEEGAMDFRFERFLIEQKQLPAAAAKILEINPNHSIIQSLGHANDASVDDVTWLLFDQARILEGEPVSDPTAFTRRLQSFVEKSLAA